MNRLIIFVLPLLSIYFTANNIQLHNANEIVKIKEIKSNDEFIINDSLYRLHFQIETTKNNEHYLIINIKLKNGSHFIPPFTNQDFIGRFYMDLGSYTHLDFEGDIIETPQSIEEYDGHSSVNGTANWARVNTTYKQALKIKLQEDFEVFGRIRFTIEPRCRLEEAPFSISYQSGKMTIKSPKC